LPLSIEAATLRCEVSGGCPFDLDQRSWM
jgi:hypothetical protein